MPANSAVMVESELFLMAGRMMVHCFLYGGPGFPGLSPAITHVLCGGSIDTATVMIEDCPDLDIRETIQLVSLATLILLHIVRESRLFALFNIVKARAIKFVENFWSNSTFQVFAS